MPGGAAGHNHHALGIQHLPTVIYECRERYVISLEIYSTAHTVRQALRLLKDFLQHKVRIAAFLYLPQIDIHRLHRQFLFLTENAHHLQFFAPADHGDVAILQIDHLVRILHNRAGI